MRKLLVLAFSVAAVTALSGCPAKLKKGECKTSQDCLDQGGLAKVCVEGRCQECAQDADCKPGFVCRQNACVPKPQCGADSDCPTGQRCENEKCVARADMGGGADAAAAKPRVPPECSDATAFTIRFGFDQSMLTSDSQGRLQKLAGCLKQAPARRVVVQGHADERGTTQYNIALGGRRAEAAKKYLSDLGAAGASLETVSFGEEKPVCSEQSEDCWARNRRDEFQVER